MILVMLKNVLSWFVDLAPYCVFCGYKIHARFTIDKNFPSLFVHQHQCCDCFVQRCKKRGINVIFRLDVE